MMASKSLAICLFFTCSYSIEAGTPLIKCLKEQMPNINNTQFIVTDSLELPLT